MTADVCLSRSKCSYTDRMQARHTRGSFRTIVLLTVSAALLLALLIPQPQDHHGKVLAAILLLPLFLSGILKVQTASWRPCSLEQQSTRPLSCRPALFQKPPPSSFA